MRILVIEDDAALASYIRKSLESDRYTVDVALDGEQGALMASDLDYDLLVLDLNLPKLDGIAVLHAGQEVTMPALWLSDFQRRVEGISELPSLPAILFPVLNQLEGNEEDVDIHKTVQLVSHDGALST